MSEKPSRRAYRPPQDLTPEEVRAEANLLGEELRQANREAASLITFQWALADWALVDSEDEDGLEEGDGDSRLTPEQAAMRSYSWEDD